LPRSFAAGAGPAEQAHARIQASWDGLSNGDLMTQTRCEGCGAEKPAHDFIRTRSLDREWRVLCSQCFNDEMAQFTGHPDFEHPSFTPLRLRDAHCDEHEFHFRSLLLGDQLSLGAFELAGDDDPAGYRFQCLGKPESEPSRCWLSSFRKSNVPWRPRILSPIRPDRRSPRRWSGAGSSGMGTSTPADHV
jgi:hypothetical protein